MPVELSNYLTSMNPVLRQQSRHGAPHHGQTVYTVCRLHHMNNDKFLRCAIYDLQKYTSHT
jgi:hypothetical protein